MAQLKRYLLNIFGLPSSHNDENGNEMHWEYDEVGRLTSIVDATGDSANFEWDELNQLVSATDRLGNVYAYEYDSLRRMIQSTNPDGGVTKFDYDAEGRMISMLDPIGRLTEYFYDDAGQLTEQRVSGLSFDPISTNFQYDSVGNRTAVTDDNGNTTLFEYDGANRLVSKENSLGENVEYQYDQVGNIIEQRDELGRVWTYVYDDLNRQISATDPLAGIIQRTYDDLGNLLSITDQNNHTTSFAYDSRNRIVTVTDAASEELSYGYDGIGNVISITDRLGRVTQFSYDEEQQLTERTNALGDMAFFDYDAEGNLTSYQDEEGHLWEYQYDNVNRLTAVIDPLLGVQSYDYDLVGQLTGYTDQNSHTTSYEHDLLGNFTKVTNALGDFEQYEYDGVGNLLTYTDGMGRDTHFSYDALNRLDSIVDAAGFFTAYTYDRVGNLVAFDDQLGNQRQYEYDNLDRLIKRTDALGGEMQYVYDAVGNTVEVIDELGRKTVNEYDSLDRLIKTTDPRLSETEFTYDAVGNLVVLNDSLGQTTTYAFDDLNRLTERTDSLGNSATFGYDKVGNVIETIDRNGRQRTFEYDGLDRLIAEQWWDNTTLVNEIQFLYDPVGNLLEVGDAFSHYTYTYDAIDRLLTVDNLGTPGAPHVQLTYQYDAVGNVTSIADNLGATVNSTYDERNLLTKREWTINAIDEAMIAFEYDPRGLLSRVERYSDIAGTNLISTSESQYDDLGRMTDLTHRDVIDAVVADYDFTWDAAHQLLSETHHGETIIYTHDLAGQLTDADYGSLPDENYSYDDNGNRTGGGYVTGPNNRILSDGEFDYTYDNEGNVVTKTEIATGDVTTYEYDHRNRLVRVETRTSGGILLSESEFVHDVFDRLIAHTIDTDGAGPLAAEMTHFFHDGDHVWAEFNNQGDIIARYLYGETIDQLLARWRSADHPNAAAHQGVAWYLTDRMGTVRDIVDANGALIDTITYDSFGNILSETNPLAGDRFKFTGREWFDQIGLYYYRARFYDPRIGKFTSQDPLRFAAGDTNLYRYVFNAPTEFTDPYGLLTVEEKVFIRNASLIGLGVAGVICLAGDVGEMYVEGNYTGISVMLAIAGVGLFTSFALVATATTLPFALVAAGAVVGAGFGIYAVYERSAIAINAWGQEQYSQATFQGVCAGVDLAASIITLTEGWNYKPRAGNEPELGGGDGGLDGSPTLETPESGGGNGRPNCFVAGTLVHLADESNSTLVESVSSTQLWVVSGLILAGVFGRVKSAKKQQSKVRTKWRSVRRRNRLEQLLDRTEELA